MFPLWMMMKPYINLPPPVEWFSKDVFIWAVLYWQRTSWDTFWSKQLQVVWSNTQQFLCNLNNWYIYELEKIWSNYIIRLYNEDMTSLLYEKYFNSNIYTDTIRFWISESDSWNTAMVDYIYYNIDWDIETKNFNSTSDFTSNWFSIDFTTFNWASVSWWNWIASWWSMRIKKTYWSNINNSIIRCKFLVNWNVWGLLSSLDIYNSNVFFYEFRLWTVWNWIFWLSNNQLFNWWTQNTYYIVRMQYSWLWYITYTFYNQDKSSILYTINHNINYNIFNLRLDINRQENWVLELNYINYDITYTDSTNDNWMLDFYSFEEIEDKWFIFEWYSYNISWWNFIQSTWKSFFTKSQNKIISWFDIEARLKTSWTWSNSWWITLKAF